MKIVFQKNIKGFEKVNRKLYYYTNLSIEIILLLNTELTASLRDGILIVFMVLSL
jgi:hypothetical protein